jgi:hypothetical protein
MLIMHCLRQQVYVFIRKVYQQHQLVKLMPINERIKVGVNDRRRSHPIRISFVDHIIVRQVINVHWIAVEIVQSIVVSWRVRKVSTTVWWNQHVQILIYHCHRYQWIEWVRCDQIEIRCKVARRWHHQVQLSLIIDNQQQWNASLIRKRFTVYCCLFDWIHSF